MKTAKAGMTALELVIASGVAVILGLCVFGAFYSGRSAWRAGEAVVEPGRSAAGALDVMQREISSMFIFPPGTAVENTGLFYGEEKNGFREFRFYALVTRHSGSWDICRVGYRHNSEKREIERLFNVDVHEEKQMVWHSLAAGVNSLEFILYSRDGTRKRAFDSWDTFSEDPAQRGRIPEEVAIIIGTQDEMGVFEERRFELLVPVLSAGKTVAVQAPCFKEEYFEEE